MVKIKHIMITAGGTAEAIDGVRKISNTSTGSLAACIYDALAEHFAQVIGASDGRVPEFIVHYVVSETAVMPEENANLPIKFYTVTDVDSVEFVLDKLLIDYKIDYIIHSMAVSDFTKGYLIEQEELICELAETLEKTLNDNQKDLSEEQLKEYIGNILKSPKRILKASSKVSSKAELMLSLKKTPKLIDKIKKLSPKSFLVGFKLLKGVSEEELISVAKELSKNKGCNLVLANDMDKIRNDGHEALLLNGGRVIGRYNTKKEIARGIVQHMFNGTSDDAETGSIITGDCL